jgi:hypothetical protein
MQSEIASLNDRMLWLIQIEENALACDKAHWRRQFQECLQRKTSLEMSIEDRYPRTKKVYA